MKIMLPINNPDMVSKLKKVANDSEFYAGFYPDRWMNKFGNVEFVNKRGFSKESNGEGFDYVTSLKNACGDSQLHIVFNAPIHSEIELSFMGEIFEQLAIIPIASVIVSDPKLIPIVRECGINVSISTIFGAYNSDLVQYCANMGANRVILPRDLTLQEISDIIQKNPELEYECFIMLEGCIYSNSQCLIRHSCGAICLALDVADSHMITFGDQLATKRYDFENNRKLFTHKKGAFYRNCGLCAVWDFMQMGVKSLKIVGRAKSEHKILLEAEELQHAMEIATECDSRREFLDRCHISDIRKKRCAMGLGCYYPEVFYENKM